MSTQPLKADELFAAWSRRQFKSIYLFTGPEDWLIEQAMQQLAKQRLPSDTTGVNRDRFDGDEASVGEILQACQTMPFGGSYRFVEVQNTNRLSADNQKKLAEGLEQLPESTELVLVWGKEWRRDDANKPLVEAVARVGDVVIFWPLFPEQAQRWLIQRAKHYQKTLAPEAAEWLIEEMGPGLRSLDQELAKVSVYVGGRPEIALQDLQDCFGYQKASSPYDWLTALRQRQGPQSMQTLRRLLDEGEEPLRLLSMVSGSLRDWLAAKESGENASALARRFNVRRGSESFFYQELQKLTTEDLIAGLSSCVEAHQSIKTGKETPPMALTLLTLRLCDLETVHSG